MKTSVIVACALILTGRLNGKLKSPSAVEMCNEPGLTSLYVGDVKGDGTGITA